MGRHNNSMHSSRASTPLAGVKDRKKHQRRLDGQGYKPMHVAPNSTLMMGPITREERSKHKKVTGSNSCQSEKTVGGDPRPDSEELAKNLHRAVKSAPATAKSRTTHSLLVSIDIIMITLFLARLFPSEYREWSGTNLVAASEVMSYPMTHALIKYAKQASYPFMLFVPSLVLICATILSVTDDDEKSTAGEQLAHDGRMRGWKRVLSWMGICTGLLFGYLAAMIAFAETSRWVLLGVASFATPAILMIFTERTRVCRGIHDVVSWPWHPPVEMTKVAKLIGFVFVFLPFIAGFFYAISPPFILAVPLSSLANCSLAGLLGLVPFLLSIAYLIAGWHASTWTLSKLFRIYSWMVNRHSSMLLLLTCTALLLATLQLRIPSYL